MTFRVLSISIIFMVELTTAHAQNPVKNPSFEEGSAQYNFAITSDFLGSYVATNGKGRISPP
jgi:hypothetical protein